MPRSNLSSNFHFIISDTIRTALRHGSRQETGLVNRGCEMEWGRVEDRVFEDADELGRRRCGGTWTIFFY